MKAGNLPDLIKYLTVIYFSLFSVFLCYTDDARVTEFRKYAVQSNSYGIINYNIHSQALFAMSDLSAAESNNVEAYISFLRKKFHYLDSKVTIGTVRKVGYRLESEETS